jgi:hypothetical protein
MLIIGSDCFKYIKRICKSDNLSIGLIMISLVPELFKIFSLSLLDTIADIKIIGI